MRTGGALFHITHLSENTASEATNTAKATFSPPAAIQRSPWHSPVPYLFGGLAAMLGLIAFALLILACSYWRFSGQVNNGEGDGAAATAEKGESSSEDKASHVYEEKYLVIMAGEVNPTFLATPMSSRASSFNDDNKKLDGKETEKTKNPINENQLTPTAEENAEESTQGSSPTSQEQIH